MTTFIKSNPDGSTVIQGTIEQASMLKCPHCIIVFEHYRPDGSCRCNDPNETIMKEWGYKWRKGQWQ